METNIKYSSSNSSLYFENSMSVEIECMFVYDLVYICKKGKD